MALKTWETYLSRNPLYFNQDFIPVQCKEFFNSTNSIYTCCNKKSEEDFEIILRGFI
jgi:hypothetical protein